MDLPLICIALAALLAAAPQAPAHDDANAGVAAPSLAGDEAIVSAAGKKWAALLDGQDVEHKWLAGQHVDWKTGEPDGKLEKHPEHATHCSAFVASLAEQENIPLLRPPEHGPHELANAQFDWLAAEGPAHGWTPVATALEAQQRANRGEWVLAVYKSAPGKHGHIAVVRPAVRSAAQIEADGPEVTQAGKHNFQSASLAAGFSQHREAWGTTRAVRFFAHALALP